MVNVLAWIVLGGVVGWLARWVARGTGLGVVLNVLVGVVGAIIGGVLFRLLLPTVFGLASLNLRSWGIALLSSVILLYLVRSMGVTMRSPRRR